MSNSKISEVAENHNWIDRVNSEIRSQLQYVDMCASRTPSLPTICGCTGATHGVLGRMALLCWLVGCS